MIDVEIKMGDLLKKLELLPEKIQKRVLNGAVRASAKPIIQDAKARVHNVSGVLAKSIGVNKRRSKNKNVVIYTISPRVKRYTKNKPTGLKRGSEEYKKTYGAYYGMWVELGHVIRNKKGKEIGHVPPHPFLRPAFEAKGKESIKAFKEYLAKRLEKELNK